MSAHGKQPNEASKTHTLERVDEASTKLSPNLIEDRIKSNMEPLHAQISTMTQMMNKLIQDNSARTNSTAGSRDHRFPYESPLTGDPEFAKPFH